MIHSSFNMVDFAVIIIIGLSILIGIVRGATREVLGIAGWVGAFAIVFYGLPLFRPLGRTYIQNPMLADAVVAGILFVISLTFFILISRLISSSVKSSVLSGFDRSLGLLFGFIRGGLVICLAYLSMSFFYSTDKIPQVVQSAHFTSWIAQGTIELKRLIPRDYLPQNISQASTINPLDAKDLIENSLPTLEDTVKTLSTLKPTSLKPSYTEKGKADLDNLIEKNE